MTSMFPRVLLAASLAFGVSGAAHAAKDLVVGVPDNLTGLDPADLNDNLSQSAARLMFEGLYMLDEHMKLKPQLAESYEATEDAKEFTFHLRKGVTFHDGTPFNAAAVKASFDRAGNPENHLKRQSLFVMIDHTDVVDDATVKVVLKYPFGAFVNDIAHPGALIVSPKSVQEFGKEMTRHPSGTGPYQFVSWSADTLKMKRNEHYWKPGLPKIDTITYRGVPENGARIAMLQTGEAQFIFPVPPEMIKSLEGSSTITVFDEPSIFIRYVALNNMRKPFDDPRVREALNYAVDKQAFLKVVFSGHADAMDSPMPPLLGFYQKQGSRPYDPAKAKALLTEAGFPNGVTLKAIQTQSPSMLGVMQVVQAQLRRAGINLELEVVEHATFHSMIRKDLGQVIEYSAARFPVADTYLTQFYHSRSSIGTPTAVTNFSHCNEADQEIDSAAIEPNIEQKKKLWKLAQQKIMTKVCSVPLFESLGVWARRDDLAYGYKYEGSLSGGPVINEMTQFK